MSAPFDEVRNLAVTNAQTELGRRPREIGMENRGPIIDVYLRNARVSQSVIDGTSQSAADSRMWCGMFIFYCYTLAAQHFGLTLPFRGTDLWGGRRLRIWASQHPDSRVTDGTVQAGDIFAIRNDHIGMAIGPAVNSIFHTIEGNQGSTTTS